MPNLISELVSNLKLIGNDIKEAAKSVLYSIRDTEYLENKIIEKENEIADINAIKEIEIERILQEYRDELECECMGEEDIDKQIEDLKKSLDKEREI